MRLKRPDFYGLYLVSVFQIIENEVALYLAPLRSEIVFEGTVNSSTRINQQGILTMMMSGHDEVLSMSRSIIEDRLSSTLLFSR